MNQVRALDVDVVLIDLGAGTSYNILDFFLLSDVSILAVVPEPTSIENGYRFIKSALYRRLRAVAPTEPGARAGRLGARPEEPARDQDADRAARRASRATTPRRPRTLRREMAAFQPRFVVNEVRDTADVAIGHQLVAACGRHLGLRASYAGFVHHDDAVWRAVRRRRLFMADAPDLARRRGDPPADARPGQGREHGPWLLSRRRRSPRSGGDVTHDDLYAALGLEPRATSEQIERAYRFCLELYGEGGLAIYSLLEPSEAEQQRTRVREAYEVLSDPEKRQAYDAAHGFLPPDAAGAGVPVAGCGRAGRSAARAARGADRRRPAPAARGARRVAAAHRLGHEDRRALPRVHRGGPLHAPAGPRLPARLPAGVRAARRHRPAARGRRLHEPARSAEASRPRFKASRGRHG